MKHSLKAFTLVELIVVITILAILGTIAFLSLQGYSQDAKNSKVISDLRTLSTAIESRITGGMSIIDIVKDTATGSNSVEWAGRTFGNLSLDTPAVIDDASNYNVGTINFTALKQNGIDFLDPEGNDYLVAYVASGSVSYYQTAGQRKTVSHNYIAIIKGNYIDEWGNDANGLISLSGASSTGVINGDDLTSTLHLY